MTNWRSTSRLILLGAVLVLASILSIGGAVRASPIAVTQMAAIVKPLRAWAVPRASGEVFVLDATNSLYKLAPGTLVPLAWSSPLFPAADQSPAYMLADETHVFVGSQAPNVTLVLNPDDFTQVGILDAAGPMVHDPGKRLFVIWDSIVWAFGLDDLNQPPARVIPPSSSGTTSWPKDLGIDLAARQLIVRFYDNIGSSPHNPEHYGTYNLDTFAEVGSFNSQPGDLSRPAVAERTGLVVATVLARNGFLGSNLAVFNQQHQELRRYTPIDGVPAVDSAGTWIYLLRERGLWILRASDLSLRSVVPFRFPPPTDLALSPDDKTLYLFGNEWLNGWPISELQAMGIESIGPFPAAWLYADRNEFVQPRFYPSPEMDRDQATFVQVGGYGETYRTTDGGRLWEFLAALTYPKFRYVRYLSLSPDFASDGTLIARPAGGAPMLRSVDRGSTWAEWTPRIAFVSDRDGNREVYTLAQDGSDVRRLTNHPAADETPAWSPAWTRVAFASNRNGNWDLFTVKATCDASQGEGSDLCDVRQLTDNPADDLLPAWSPDGRSIAFVTTRDGNPEIYVMDKDGQNQRRLTFNPTGDWRPAWMPDSRHLLFASDRGGNNDIYSLEVPPPGVPAPASEVGLRAVVTGPSDDRDPATGADGVSLLFLSDREGVMKAYWQDLTVPHANAYPVTDTKLPEGHPSWVDDGSGMILVAAERDGASNVYRVSSPATYSPLTTSPGFNGHPAWGPVWWLPDVATSRAELEKGK